MAPPWRTSLTNGQAILQRIETLTDAEAMALIDSGERQRAVQSKERPEKKGGRLYAGVVSRTGEGTLEKNHLADDHGAEPPTPTQDTTRRGNSVSMAIWPRVDTESSA